jgi:hypothetical protein
MVLVELRPQVDTVEQPTAAKLESWAVDSRIDLIRRNIHGDVIETFSSIVMSRASVELLIRREKILQDVGIDMQRSVDFCIGDMRQQIIAGGRYTGSPEDLIKSLNHFERTTARAYLLKNAKPEEASRFMREWAEQDALM